MRHLRTAVPESQVFKRTLPQKKRQLADLRETLANMKSTTSAALRTSVTNTIRQLENDIRIEESRLAKRLATPQPTPAEIQRRQRIEKRTKRNQILSINL